MNDIILSSLLNLFALFGAKNGTPAEESLKVIDSYLTKFYGIRNTGPYVRLYSALRDYYDDFPELDKAGIISSLCAKLTVNVKPSERPVILLRLMEFCSKGGNGLDTVDDIFTEVSSLFSIGEDSFAELVNFIQGKPSASVRVFPAGEGTLKTLLLDDRSTLLFSYDGPYDIRLDDVRIEKGIFHRWEQSSVLKGDHGFKTLYCPSVMAMYKSSADEKSVELRGTEINFRFEKGGDNGMHDFSFSLHSGEMVAIMGGSGVGKTTLLSLLNGNLKPQSGSITINGHSIEDPESKALIGFVPQDDLLIEELTVYQNLWYTARLCFNDLDPVQLDRKVMTVLEDLGLDSAKDLKVGSPINKFISGGQRKRLNVALELIREPAILFLDEPTSGLSSADTESLMGLLKAQTYKGKLIVANIHQPSSDVYKMFDRLWLLDKGGYPIYDGNPIEAVSYFKGVASYADSQTSTCPLCGNVNPEIVLNIINETRLDSSGQMTTERKTTPQEWNRMYMDRRPDFGEQVVSDVPQTGQKRPGFLKQVWLFLRRNVSAKITNAQYMLVTLLEAPALAAICAVLTRYTPDGAGYSLMDNKNFASYLFMAIIVAIFLGMSGSAEEIIRDRALLKREKFLRLSGSAYIWSKILYMGAVCLVQTLFFILVGNSIIGVQGMFWIWWLILFLSAFLSSLIGLLLSQCLNSVVAIYITIPLLLIPQILLCGLVVDFEDLNPGSKTGNVPVIGDFIPSRWSYEALAVASYSMTEYEAPYYELDRDRFEALFYERSILYELKSQVETREDERLNGNDIKPEHLKIFYTEMPRLCELTGMEPYSGDESYESLTAYLDEATDILTKRSNSLTLKRDRLVNNYIKRHGKEEYLDLKKRNHNLKLEDLVVHSKADHSHAIVGSSIVPRSGYIFLTPVSKNGRAPFYSGVKRLGNLEVPTFLFNSLILLLMSLIFAICLFADIPGRYVRKG